MTRFAVAAALVCALLQVAHADEPEPDGPPRFPIARIRELFEQGEFAEAKRLLEQQYALVPNPQLLFSLGQAEFGLGNYQAAIDDYEKFLSSGPDERQAALAQQAIGAARIKLKQQAPPEPEPEPQPKPIVRRRWHIEDTGFVALGGAAIAVGGGLLIYSHRLGNDTSGTLSQYDARLDLARTYRWTGIGVGAAGTLLVGVTILRWRLRPDGSDGVTASLTPSSVMVSGRW